MTIPAQIIIVLLVANIGLCFCYNGQALPPRKVSWVAALINATTTLSFLYWGGFFEAARP